MSASPLTQAPVLPFSSAQEKKSVAEIIASDHSLLEIDRELDILFDQMQDELEENGVASSDSVARFHAFCEAHGEKVDRIGRFIRVMEARTTYCKAEAARLTARGKSAENKADQTKALVLYYLQSREMSKMEGKQFTLRCQKNSQDSVRVSDLSLLPLSLKRVEARFDGVTWERILGELPPDLKNVLTAGIQDLAPMNDAIKQAIARNEVVEGAVVNRGYHIRVA